MDPRKGILVLPFVNRSREEDSDYIGEGIADEIMAALSRLEVLRVISRNSATQIAHEELDLTSIGHQLNVQYLLQGSVQKSGSKLRITAQLPDTESGELLWADKWNSNLDQIFNIQETIARAVVDALNVQLNSNQEAQLSNRPIPNIHAYEYYLRARQLIYNYTPTALAQALDYLNRGQQLIGENAHITAAVGYVHWQYYNAGIELDPEHLKATHDCADRLFALDSESTDAHRLMGLVSMLEKGAIQTSVRHLKLALDGDANDTDALFWLALFYGFAGRISSGQALVERLLAIDPLTTLPQILPGFLDMMDGNLERGRARLLKGHNLNEGNPITTLAYGQVLAMNANLEEAEEVFSLLNEFVPDSFLSQLGKFYIYAMHKDKDAALSVATKEFQQEASSDPHYAWGLAHCFSLIQAKAEAFEWLQIAIQNGFWNYPLLSEHDPLLAFVRSDERFAELMDDLKTKWIYFEV